MNPVRRNKKYGTKTICCKGISEGVLLFKAIQGKLSNGMKLGTENKFRIHQRIRIFKGKFVAAGFSLRPRKSALQYPKPVIAPSERGGVNSPPQRGGVNPATRRRGKLPPPTAGKQSQFEIPPLVKGDTGGFEDLRKELLSRKYSYKTVKGYLYYNRDFLRFVNKQPSEINDNDIKDYLFYLAEERKQ